MRWHNNVICAPRDRVYVDERHVTVDIFTWGT